MRTSLSVLAVAVSISWFPAFAETVRLTDGRTVDLKEDGTFQVLSENSSAAEPASEVTKATDVATLVDTTPLEELRNSHLEHLVESSKDERDLAEAKLLARIKKIPSDNKKENALGYYLLMNINPTNGEYQKKYDIYTSVPVTDIANVEKNLSDNRTRVQRDAFWEKIKGSRVAIDGRVEDVRPSGFISYGSVDIKAASGVSVHCDLTEKSARDMGEIEKGQRVRCEGTASVYSIVFGELLLNVSDGVITQR